MAIDFDKIDRSVDLKGLQADVEDAKKNGGGDFPTIPAGKYISIHAPRAGGRLSGGSTPVTPELNFNPRPPCGGRRSENSSSLHPSGSPLSA